MMPNLNELREAVELIQEEKDIYYSVPNDKASEGLKKIQDSLQLLLDLARQVLEVSEWMPPKPKCCCGATKTTWGCECGAMATAKAIDGITIAIVKKLEGLRIHMRTMNYSNEEIEKICQHILGGKV